MGTEIERKFIVSDRSCVDGLVGTRMEQGYLAFDHDRTVRVRMTGDAAWVTIKGRAQGIRRAEFEYAIPNEDATSLLAMCLPSIIDKTRYRISVADHVWEVDVFHGANEGLFMAEVELEDENDALIMPPWIGLEVSGDSRFFNSSLSIAPFSSFKDSL